MKKILIGILLFTNVVYGQSRLDSLFIKGINKYRIENSLDTINWSSGLRIVADDQLNYIIRTSNFDHNQMESLGGEPIFGNRFDKHNLPGNYFGENLGMSNAYEVNNLDSLVDVILGGWKKSPKHNIILLRPFIKFGAISSKVVENWSSGIYLDDETGAILETIFDRIMFSILEVSD